MRFWRAERSTGLRRLATALMILVVGALTTCTPPTTTAPGLPGGRRAPPALTLAGTDWITPPAQSASMPQSRQAAEQFLMAALGARASLATAMTSGRSTDPAGA